MKKHFNFLRLILLISLLFSLNELKAQCTVTVSPVNPVKCGNTAIRIKLTGSSIYHWPTNRSTIVWGNGPDSSEVLLNPQQTLTYTVVGETGTCRIIKTFTVKVPPTVGTPVLTQKLISGTGCGSSNTNGWQFSLSATNANRYFWRVKLSTQSGWVEGNPTLNVYQSGSYSQPYVEAYATNECYTTTIVSAWAQVKACREAEADIDHSAMAMVQVLDGHILAINHPRKETLRMVVRTPDGKVAMENFIHTTRVEVDVEHLENGIYICSLEDGKGIIYHQKISIVHP